MVVDVTTLGPRLNSFPFEIVSITWKKVIDVCSNAHFINDNNLSLNNMEPV